MALVPDPPTPAARPKPEQMAVTGPLGGPSYAYRGAIIDCQPGGYVCVLKMPGHPLNDHRFGAVGTVTALVDLWLDDLQLPSYMRPMPPAKP